MYVSTECIFPSTTPTLTMLNLTFPGASQDTQPPYIVLFKITPSFRH